MPQVIILDLLEIRHVHSEEVLIPRVSETEGCPVIVKLPSYHQPKSHDENHLVLAGGCIKTFLSEVNVVHHIYQVCLILEIVIYTKLRGGKAYKWKACIGKACQTRTLP